MGLVFLVGLLVGSVKIVIEKVHFFTVLLSLDLVLICVCGVWVSGGFSGVSYGGAFVVVVMVLGVCEACVGLSLLVCYTRKAGVDCLKSVFMV